MGDQASTCKWKKSSFSDSGACIELAKMGDGNIIGLRDSNNPDQVVTATRADIRAFVQGANAGEFDEFC